MNANSISTVRNGQKVDLASLPLVAFEEFRDAIVSAVKAGARLGALFGVALQETDGQGSQAMRVSGDFRLFAVLAQEAEGMLAVTSTRVGDTYPALTPDCPQAHWFEREIAEQWGVKPEGHPWLKPIRFHHSYREGRDAWNRPLEIPIQPGVTNFFTADEQHTPPCDTNKVHLLLMNRSDDGKTVAAAGWAYEPGQGRLCYLANGHTREALNHPMFQRLLRNAVNWCLKRED